MAALDFPASPTNGQQYQGFTFNGVGWIGGQGPGPQLNPVEQFFDMAGKVSVDITIPSWANAVEIDGVFYAASPGGQTVAAWYSVDGTTFINTGYTYAGPTNNSGSNFYQTTPAAATTSLWLSIAGDQAALYGHDVEALITVRRPTTSAYFTCKAFAKSYDLAAASAYRTSWLTSLLSGTLSSVLQMQKLRIGFSGGAACTAGSYVKVKWIGDPGSIASAVRSDNLGIYSCAITCNANQSVNSAAFAKVDAALNSIVHDPSGMWDNTNKRIIPKREGLYLFSGLTSIETLPDAVRMVTAVYKNGVLAALLGRGSTGVSAIAGFGGSVLLKANGTTDYFELWVYHNAGSAQNVVGTIAGGYAGYTHFGATYIGNDAPSTAVMGDAPSDSRPYSRKNGLWTPSGPELISTTTFAGKLLVDITLPAGPKDFQIRLRNLALTTGSSEYLWCFVSMDGTTFNKTDSAYNWRQIYTAGSGVTPSQWASAAGSAMGIVTTPIGVQSSAGYSMAGFYDIDPGALDHYGLLQNTMRSMFSTGIYLSQGAGYLGILGRWQKVRIQAGIGAGLTFSRGDADLYGYW